MKLQLSRSTHLALSISARAVLISLISMLVIRLLSTTQLYATALVAIAIGGLIVADLARLIARANYSAEHMLNLLHADGMDSPSIDKNSGATFFVRTAATLSLRRRQSQQQIEHLQCLLDTVAASLLVVSADGSVVLANRAAQQLAGVATTRLSEIAAIGTPAAEKLLGLAPGMRQIIHLADGQPMLVAVALFSIPNAPRTKLISLQRIAGELDAVELKAWQDIAHVLAHEIMNSLTPISSLSESLEYLLRDAAQSKAPSDPTANNAEIAGALEAIKRRSLGLMNFVERYRQVAELPQPNPRQLRMDMFLGGIERLIAPSFRDRSITYRQRILPVELSCYADPELLEQALINLLRNAADAVKDSPHATIDVTCRLQNSQLHIAVSDNGHGLPNNHRERLFVPFFTTKPNGSGIGLSLARHIALAHGGQLLVQDNLPSGSIFTLVLPTHLDS